MSNSLISAGIPGPSSRCANKANLVTDKGKQYCQHTFSTPQIQARKILAEKTRSLGVFSSSVATRKEINRSQKP